MFANIGKQTRLSFCLSLSKSNAPFSLIHSDVWQAPVVSNSGFRYYILFLDDYTRFSWIYLMHNKSEAFEKFKQFQAMVQNVFHALISYFQSGGKEFDNNAFKSFFQQFVIIHRLSCPHTSPQNGRAERKHKHVANVLRCLLFQASMPFSFWADASLFVVLLINITPLPSLNYQSPFELLYG